MLVDIFSSHQHQATTAPSNSDHFCVTIMAMWKGLAIWERILPIIASIPVLTAIRWVGAIAYLMHTKPGPLNSAGERPPTACTVQTAE